ncbi:MAG: hypothetical protein HDS71_05635 [Bacteroidales bacterium]|nr:hypothetical protein [Bacteroidales bacterium]
MTNKIPHVLGYLATAALLAGCTDSAYDLSDIDTTTELKVNNLAVPINMEAITLDQIIDVKEGESLKVIDGKYAVMVEGQFNSDPIKINDITIDAPVINPTVSTLNQRNESNGPRKAAALLYDVPTTTTSFSYFNNDIDPSIKSISVLKTRNFTLSIRLSLAELQGIIDHVQINQMTFVLPKGLKGTASMGTYSSTTGKLVISNVEANPSGLQIDLPITEIDMAKAEAKFDAATRTFDFTGNIDIESGVIGVDPTLVSGSVPSTINLHVDYNMSKMDVESLTGTMEYAIEDINIPDVDLNNLPDFLRQEGTNIVLNNPQIYLSLNNPLYETGINASTGLTLTAIREGRPTNVCTLPTPMVMTTEKAAGPYNFCLSPSKPSEMYGDFAGSEYKSFPTLGTIVEGNGLPNSIHIIADEPGFEEQAVKDLKVGYDYGTIEGSYVFYAPLSLSAGSTIYYSDSDTDWGSEDLDDLTIETLIIKATVDSDVDAALELTGNPLDRSGNAIANAEVSTVSAPANAKDYPIEITVTGPFSGLDGFNYRVKLVSAGDKTLAPDQKIKLNNIKAYATGKFVKKL